MIEEEALTAVHDILHDASGGKLERIDRVCHRYVGPSSTVVAQIHTTRHSQMSAVKKLIAIHDQVHDYFEGPPPQPEPEYDGIIEGEFAGIVPSGQHWHITGDVELTGDLVYEGLLTSVDTFTVTGNGFQILGQHGGIAQLAGKVKSGWVRRGQPVSNWQSGDRLVVAPMVEGLYLPSLTSWGGSWESTVWPDTSPDFELPDGRIIGAEVGNLDRSIRFNKLRRFHLHDGAGPQSLKHLAIVDSGTAGVLGDYPLHFHLNGESSRGSHIDGVVVERGKNHAFVPHGSHGIFCTDTIAYDIIGDAYWWDFPPERERKADPRDPINDSNDMLWQHALAILVHPTSSRTGGLVLGAGLRVGCPDSAATCVQGVDGPASQRAGAVWPENAGLSSWDTRGLVCHNNVNGGVFVWQNAREFENHVEDCIGFFNGRADIDHGSYMNRYQYRRFVLGPAGFLLHAKSAIEGPLALEDGISAGPLIITKHNSSHMDPTYVRRCRFPKIIYREPSNGSVMHYEDCGFTPADFDLGHIVEDPIGIAADSIIEIKEGEVLTHRWAAGDWS